MVNPIWWLRFCRLKLRRAGSSARPLRVFVSLGRYEIEGWPFRTVDELGSFLLAYRPGHVRISGNKTMKYKEVAVVIGALQKIGGADLGIIGHEAPSTGVRAPSPNSQRTGEPE